MGGHDHGPSIFADVGKDAHDIVGKLVRYSEDNDLKIKNIPNDKLSEFHPDLSQDELRLIMTPEYAVKQKRSIKK